MVIVGLSGYAGVGKDTVGDLLVERHGFRKAAFADPMREMMAALDPVVALDDGELVRYGEVVEVFGYDEAKRRVAEIRQLMQRLGTEAGRGVLGESIWVDTLIGRLADGADWVVCDVRFPNELAALAAAGGVTVRMARPGVTAANGHVSERALDDAAFDRILLNDGGLVVLQRRVDELVGELRAAAAA